MFWQTKAKSFVGRYIVIKAKHIFHIRCAVLAYPIIPSIGKSTVRDYGSFTLYHKLSTVD